MNSQKNTEQKWLTIFRTDYGNKWLHEELRHGRLRQGWGVPGLSLIGERDKPVDKMEREAAYPERTGWGDPSQKRFAILKRMLELDDGNIVVMPKMPDWNQFTVARVRGRYRFEVARGRDDFGHIVPVYRDSVRSFTHRANNEAFLVSALFSRANHRPAVTFCYGAEQVSAVHRLLEMPSSEGEKPQGELLAGAMDHALQTAAKSLAKTVKTWNGQRFENAVRQRFIDQGYQVVKDYKRYDGKGSDMDMVVSPPPSRHGLFLPEEIAVQVKWKWGIDKDDAEAVKQIRDWAKWQDSAAAKCVISSASQFTEEAREEAAANDVELIGGLQTMCFLLGLADRYREDWEKPS